MNDETVRSTLEAFRGILDRPGKQENAIQAFIEKHTQFMLTPGLLNHRLHLNCIISKFPIGNRKVDYAYLTKSSDEWKLILVELEDSHKKLFIPSSKHHGFSGEMNDSIAQVDEWRDYWNENKKAVIETLEPLLVPPAMRRNPVTLECVLIIGRSNEKDRDESRRKRLASLRADKQIHVMTYDTLIRAQEKGHETSNAILTKTGGGYRLRSVEGLPNNLFAYVYPEHLSISPNAESALRAAKYDIDAWLNNEPLLVNEKWPMRNASKQAEEAGAHPSMARLLKNTEQSLSSDAPE